MLQLYDNLIFFEGSRSRHRPGSLYWGDASLWKLEGILWKLSKTFRKLSETFRKLSRTFRKLSGSFREQRNVQKHYVLLLTGCSRLFTEVSGSF